LQAWGDPASNLFLRYKNGVLFLKSLYNNKNDFKPDFKNYILIFLMITVQDVKLAF